MDDCLFCKIVKKEIESYILYEDPFFIAFLDIFPRTKGHTLVIPKKHYRWVYDVEDFGKYWESVKKVTSLLQTSLNPSFITYVTHGLQVPHAHIHIMPRFGDDPTFVPGIQNTSKDALKTLAETILSSKK